MKSIAIIGAGIGGCTTYLFLKKHLSPLIPDLSIHIYESYPPPNHSRAHSKQYTTSVSESSQPQIRFTSSFVPDVTRVAGGIIGLSPNGVRVFKSLDPEIYATIKAASIESEYFGAQLSSGRALGQMKVGGPRHGHGVFMVMRAALHNAVLEKVDSRDITFEKKVKDVEDAESVARVNFEDGGEVEADLVIGADGIWGKTRQAISESADIKPEYDGLLGVGGFLSEDTTSKLFKDDAGFSIPSHLVTMTFGPGSFFVTIVDKNRLQQQSSQTTPVQISSSPDLNVPSAGWFSTFPMESAPKTRTSFSSIKEQVLLKHRDWTPLIPALIERSGTSHTDDAFVLPRWIMPTLPRWTTEHGRVLLMGDAAHCMPPDLGQGVSCAAEDAMSIGLLLSAIFSSGCERPSVIETEQEKLQRFCELYTRLRKPRCEFIAGEARKAGDTKRELTWWQQVVRSVFLFIWCRTMPETANDSFLSWDVQTEVNKVLNGLEPLVKGEGSVI